MRTKHVSVGCLAMVVAVLALAAVSQASTYYVSTDGNDTTGNGTSESPWRTIRKAVDNAQQAGDTVIIAAGTYEEDNVLCNFYYSGTSNNYITYKAADAATVIVRMADTKDHVVRIYDDVSYLRFENLIFDGKLEGGAQTVSHEVIRMEGGASYVEFIGCEIRNSADSGFLAKYDEHHITLQNCSLHHNGDSDFGHGIYYMGSDGLFEGCTINSNGGWGVHLYAHDGQGQQITGKQNNIVRKCTIYGNGAAGATARGWGIGMYGGENFQVYNNLIYANKGGIVADYSLEDSLIAHNVIYDNKALPSYSCYGIRVGSTSGIDVYNNSISENVTQGVYIDGSASSPEVKGNCFYHNSAGSGWSDRYKNFYDPSSRATTSDNLPATLTTYPGVDPSMLNPGSQDFRLTVYSPCRNSGLTLAMVAEDFVGITRAQGSGYDIGAYECRYYVVATTGDDDNPGTDDEPFQTIGKGVSVLTAGDTVLVKSGTYAESIDDTTPSGDSWNNPVVVSAYPGHTPVLQPDTGSYRAFYFNGSSTKYIVVDGFDIDGQGLTLNGDCVTINGGANHIRFQNCQIHDAYRHGVWVYGTGSDANEFIDCDICDNGTASADEHGVYISSSNNVVRGCEILSNAKHGVQLYSGTNDANVLRDCIVADNAYRGIVIYTSGANGHAVFNNVVYGNTDGIYISGAGSNHICNNTIYGNSSYGVYVTNASGNLLANNIVSTNTNPGIYLNVSAQDSEVYNNCVYNNDTTNEINYVNHGSNTTLSGNLPANLSWPGTDPKLVSPASPTRDFHLESSSPCIDEGVEMLEVNCDFEGDARPQSSYYDIGADEY